MPFWTYGNASKKYNTTIFLESQLFRDNAFSRVGARDNTTFFIMTFNWNVTFIFQLDEFPFQCGRSSFLVSKAKYNRELHFSVVNKLRLDKNFICLLMKEIHLLHIYFIGSNNLERLSWFLSFNLVQGCQHLIQGGKCKLLGLKDYGWTLFQCNIDLPASRPTCFPIPRIKSFPPPTVVGNHRESSRSEKAFLNIMILIFLVHLLDTVLQQFLNPWKYILISLDHPH